MSDSQRPRATGSGQCAGSSALSPLGTPGGRCRDGPPLSRSLLASTSSTTLVALLCNSYRCIFSTLARAARKTCRRGEEDDDQQKMPCIIHHRLTLDSSRPRHPCEPLKRWAAVRSAPGLALLHFAHLGVEFPLPASPPERNMPSNCTECYRPSIIHFHKPHPLLRPGRQYTSHPTRD